MQAENGTDAVRARQEAHKDLLLWAAEAPTEEERRRLLDKAEREFGQNGVQGLAADPSVIALARRNLEPVDWWLAHRPGRNAGAAEGEAVGVGATGVGVFGGDPSAALPPQQASSPPKPQPMLPPMPEPSLRQAKKQPFLLHPTPGSPAAGSRPPTPKSIWDDNEEDHKPAAPDASTKQIVHQTHPPDKEEEVFGHWALRDVERGKRYQAQLAALDTVVEDAIKQVPHELVDEL
jgi:hypothetical protein